MTNHLTFQKRRWLVSNDTPASLHSQLPELSPLAVQLLFERGVISSDVSPEKNQQRAEQFLTPDYLSDTFDPFLFRDMRSAVERIFSAIDKKEKIVMYGDYDADGVSAAVILVSALKAFGAKVEAYLPHRELEGYGLNMTAVQRFIKDGVKVLITGDCGIANIKETTHAQEAGIDVIITDHHAFQDSLPPAFALIHPLLPEEKYPDKSLSGGGVAFKLAQGLLRHPEAEKLWQLKEERLIFEKWLLDMVAISSVADMVPLLGETRVLTSFGLLVLAKTRRIGLKELLRMAGLGEQKQLTAQNITFQIAPRINAAGRMDHANAAYELLMTDDEATARELAENLQQTNLDRQQMTEIVFEEALTAAEAQGEQKVYLVLGHDWPLSIVGLVAGKLAELLNRPCFVLTQKRGIIEGSGRGIDIPGINLMTALESVKYLLSTYGGHAMACGLKMKTDGDFTTLELCLKNYFEQQLAGIDLQKNLKIDAMLSLSDVNWGLFKLQEQFAPYGQKNPPPRYLLEKVKIEQIRAVGKDGKHLQLYISQGGGKIHKTIGFSCGDWCQLIRVGDFLDLVIEIESNEWNGTKELQLSLVDGRKTNQ